MTGAGTVEVTLAAPPETMAAVIALLKDLLGVSWQPHGGQPVTGTDGLAHHAGTLIVSVTSDPDVDKAVRAITELERYTRDELQGDGVSSGYWLRLSAVEQQLTALRRFNVADVDLADVRWALHLASARAKAEQHLRTVEQAGPGSQAAARNHLAAALSEVRRLLLSRAALTTPHAR